MQEARGVHISLGVEVISTGVGTSYAGGLFTDPLGVSNDFAKFKADLAAPKLVEFGDGTTNGFETTGSGSFSTCVSDLKMTENV